METQSPNLPLLQLLPNQTAVLQAYSMQAITAMANLKFTDANKFDTMMAHAYSRGQLDLARALISHDEDSLNAQQELTHNQGEQP